MGGPEITHLPPMTEINVSEISSFITSVLQELNTQNSYGIFAGVRQPGGPIIPTFIFGFPGLDLDQVILPPTPNHAPIWLREGGILLLNELETAWALESIKDVNQLTLQSCSVGIESV